MSTAKERALEISNTILAQIKASDKWALAAWGANQFIALNESNLIRGGVEFKCSGSKVRRGGKVVIELNSSDLYDVTLYRISGVNVKVLGERKGVFFDELVTALDELIG